MKRVSLFIVFIMLITLSASGQNTIGLPQIINYNKSDFNGGSQTWDIKQGTNGIMYFANNEGLLSYDGSHWILYHLPNKTIARSLFIDSEDKIYIGGQGEFGFFSPDKKGSLTYTSLLGLLPQPQTPFEDIWNIESLGESIFFRATDRIFELNNNKINVFPAVSEWRFMKRAGAKLIAQDKVQGLLEFKNNGWYQIGNKKLFDNYLVTGVIPLEKDSFLISTLKNGLFVLNNGSVISKQINENEDLIKNQTYSIKSINSEEFVAGTTSEGCYFMNLKGEVIQQIGHDEGLQNNNILCLFLDRNKNLWVGLNNGISFIDYNSAIKYIQPNKTNVLSGYSSLLYNKNLYIGTSDGTYMAHIDNDTKDLSFSKADFTQIKNSNGQVWRVEEVNEKLLMGYNDGIFEIKNDEAFPIMQGTGAWLFSPISSIFPSKYILTGTYLGLELLGFDNNHFSDLGKIEGLNESLRFLTIDNNNLIWASHPYRGVFKIKLLPGFKKCEAQLLTEKDGLPSSLGNYVYKIKNRVVFATEKGIYEYDANLKKFIPSAFLTPVFGSMEIRYLKEDNDGNIWFCSGKKLGVVSFNPPPTSNQPFSITWFPELTGQILTGAENIYPLNKQNIFVGSEKGIIHLNFEKYRTTNSKINVLLTEVNASGRNTDSLIFGGHYQEDKNSVSNSLKNKKGPKLDYDFNSFHFAYSSPAYGLQKNIEYSYRLNGNDDKWSEWSSKTEKDYTNLPPGNYMFRIKARDNLSHESEEDNFSFVIAPAWYNSMLAKSVYLLIIVGLLFLFYKIQQKKLLRQRRKFEEEQKSLKDAHQLMVEKNENEIIKLQNEKLANEVMFKNKELANASLHIVERTDSLAKVKDELQLLYKKTSNNHDVKKTLQLLKDIEKNNSNWSQFASHFDEVNNGFLKKIKNLYPELSKTDLKVCAYLQLNLSTKEMAQLMNISVRGTEIARYRLRKKLNISKEQNLTDFLNNIIGDDNK